MKTQCLFLIVTIVFFLGIPINSYAYTSYEKYSSPSASMIQVENPNDILVLVNKEHSLPNDYVPENLRNVNLPSVNGKDQLRDVAATSLEAMFKDAEKVGHLLYTLSGYRSYSRQSSIFYGYVKKYGITKTLTFSAPPGVSEHQTGLSMDISSKTANYALIQMFGQLPEGIWVKDNSWKYGFIIRYPENKTNITQYTYEPWHLRYVGYNAAKTIHKKGITLEEYLNSIKWKDDTFGALENQIIWGLSDPKILLFG